MVVLEGLLQPAEVDCTLRSTIGLDRLTLPRLYVCGSVQLCFTKDCVKTASMWPEDH
jgi:hypothetical protein